MTGKIILVVWILGMIIGWLIVAGGSERNHDAPDGDGVPKKDRSRRR